MFEGQAVARAAKAGEKLSFRVVAVSGWQAYRGEVRTEGVPPWMRGLGELTASSQ